MITYRSIFCKVAISLSVNIKNHFDRVVNKQRLAAKRRGLAPDQHILQVELPLQMWRENDEPIAQSPCFRPSPHQVHIEYSFIDFNSYLLKSITDRGIRLEDFTSVNKDNEELKRKYNSKGYRVSSSSSSSSNTKRAKIDDDNSTMDQCLQSSVYSSLDNRDCMLERDFFKTTEYHDKYQYNYNSSSYTDHTVYSEYDLTAEQELHRDLAYLSNSSTTTEDGYGDNYEGNFIV